MIVGSKSKAALRTLRLIFNEFIPISMTDADFWETSMKWRPKHKLEIK